MSPQQHDAEYNFRPRQRANTSFAAFSWRRGKADTQPPTPAAIPVPSQPLPLEALIEALTPPSVPSLGYARSLASALATNTLLPRPAVLNPVLASLCSPNSPVSLQCAGFDILGAYWENNESLVLTTADRLTYFSLFLSPTVAWGFELWEPRFKALRALSKNGAEIVGIEARFLDVLKSWLVGAFNGLLGGDTIDRAERAERERSIELLATFLSHVLARPEIIARIPEQELTGILAFYADLVHRALDIPTEPVLSDTVPLSSPTNDTHSTSSPSRLPAQTHRRHPSSISIPTPAASISPAITYKPPVDIAISLYINHLSSQVKVLSAEYLNDILPVLFRALAFYASPLPRLTVTARSLKSDSAEDQITNTLNAFFLGPYAAYCMQILKRHLLPPADPSGNIDHNIQISIGAQRTLRNYTRRGLCTRLARAYISRETNLGYTPSGAPGHMDVERDLMERAWSKDDVTGWDAGKTGRALVRSVEAWVLFSLDMDSSGRRAAREQILDEAAGTLKDILQELDSRDEENPALKDEEASIVGEALHHLASYILPLKSPEGGPFVIPLSDPTSAPSPFLRTLTSLLSRDHATALNPLLSTTLLYIADHLTDVDTAKLPVVMSEQQDLTPTSPEWLKNWESLLGNSIITSHSRPLTRLATFASLWSIYDSVRDMPSYRKPLADIVLAFCKRQSEEPDIEDTTDGDAIWRILGDEVVLRTVDSHSQGLENPTVQQYTDLLIAVASEPDEEDSDLASLAVTDAQTPSPPTTFASPTTVVSPMLSRVQSEYQGQSKDKESGLPSVMSLLSSLASGSGTRSQSSPPQLHDDITEEFPDMALLPIERTYPRVAGAVSALISIFTQIAFTPYSLSDANLEVAIRIYRTLITILADGKSVKARLTILQFMMRLRADRDHQLYYVDAGYDPDGHIRSLACLVHRACSTPVSQPPRFDETSDGIDVRKARPRLPQERDGRKASRGRGGRPSTSGPSRSRSRATAPTLPLKKNKENLWRIPETLPFSRSDANTLSEGLISYDPQGPGKRLVLPMSSYLLTITGILEKERSWEILSYVLCHLPVQLANKHLFCGPQSREATNKILTVLCTGIINGELGFHIEYWPTGLKLRDAHGLAYHTLSVLISYNRAFDIKLRHLLVEVFQAGLNSQPSTIKCCLHALTLSAVELQPSMTKSMSRILQKLSQIMSNPDMTVHILSFLSIVGSLRELHANFTEADFKMVFGVALQYLQHQNRNTTPPTSWALSEHVRIISYYVVYIWFLAVKLPDRPRHVRYITRQLLLANEGNDVVDEPTVVCFDWLARYTYGSADPRPANSLLSDIIMNPTATDQSSEIALSEKTWILGNSVVTIRTLARLGWVEVITRRPSGCTKFICRVENVPMVRPGDADPDMLSMAAGLLMERDPPRARPPESELALTEDEGAALSPAQPEDVRSIFSDGAQSHDTQPPPDPVTGYVWSGTAPSQRRKGVDLDPSYFALQLSSYPDLVDPPQHRILVDSSLLHAFIRNLDLMPVIDTHKVGIMYVAPGQTHEVAILRNTHGSPAYTRFLEGIGRLINLRGQVDVYAGGLDPDEDGEYAYAWWDDIGQILFHTATMMPSGDDDPQCINKKRHIGNDFVRIIWNDSGMPYRFDTLATSFQFVNIVIEPHSIGAIAAFSNNLHENEYFKVTVQLVPGMPPFTPIGDFKIISAENLPLMIRQLSLLADWFASIFQRTQNDTVHVDTKTNWHARLQAIQRFRSQVPVPEIAEPAEGIMGQEASLDFTTVF